MTILEHYKNEIKKAELDGTIGESLERLVECHMKEDHSGLSHFHLVHLFYKLMTTNLLTPLQGTDDEWFEVAKEDGIPLYQNNRRSSVFKKGDNIYDIDGGPIWKDKNGGHYTNKYSVLHDIKFPYTPSKREVLIEIEWIKQERLKKVDEFNKIGINDTYDFKYSLAQQEIWMWATIADSENTISKDDYDHIVAVRGFEEKHIKYLNEGLKFVGIDVVISPKEKGINIGFKGNNINLQYDLLTAKSLHLADELTFIPLIEKLEELKKILQSNFLIRKKETKWYGKSNWVVKPVINIEIEEKVNHSTGKYLFIRINGEGYVMGIGQIGELKDRLFFCKGSIIKKEGTIVYITYHTFGTTDYYLENNITTVQLFLYLIKKYKNYIVNN